MPIFIDASEHRETSSMPMVPGSKEIPGMEAICGADAIVSTLAIPPRTKVLIQKHADSGALFLSDATRAWSAGSKPDMQDNGSCFIPGCFVMIKRAEFRLETL